MRLAVAAYVAFCGACAVVAGLFVAWPPAGLVGAGVGLLWVARQMLPDVGGV